MFHLEECYRDDFKLRLRGFNYNLRLHQLEDIVYALVRMNSPANGYVLGHIMGYGKTFMQLAIAIILYLGAQLLDDIDKHPHLHLDADQDGQSPLSLIHI